MKTLTIFEIPAEINEQKLPLIGDVMRVYDFGRIYEDGRE